MGVVRDSKDCWLETFWMCGDQALPRPGNALPCPRPASQPGSACQFLPHHKQCSSPVSGAPVQPQGGQRVRSPTSERALESQLFKAEHKASTSLYPTSFWNFYQLNTAGSQELVAIFVLFCNFSVFLSFSLFFFQFSLLRISE